MPHKKIHSIIALLGVLFLSTKTVIAQPLTADAGLPQTVCKGDSVFLGGAPTASGGTAPYVYAWTSVPVAAMNNATDPNPHAKVNATTMFYLTVTDAGLTRAFDSVLITVDPIVNVSAGANATICMYFDSTTIGSAGNSAAYTYTWTPTTGLTCPTCPTTVAKPSATTTYTLVAKDAKCSDTSYVTVTVLPPPVVTTVSPVTINRGESTTLSENGLTNNIIWSPSSGGLTNGNTSSPTVTPLVTTTYTVIGTDANGCIGVDSVIVIVENDSNLIFYNTFTPNGDGINDTWYIGNIDLFPQNEVLIFNRYGEQIYRANGYVNQWDGRVGGSNVPDATYYYIVYTGTGKTYTGSVTIIREPK